MNELLWNYIVCWSHPKHGPDHAFFVSKGEAHEFFSRIRTDKDNHINVYLAAIIEGRFDDERA